MIQIRGINRIAFHFESVPDIWRVKIERDGWIYISDATKNELNTQIEVFISNNKYQIIKLKMGWKICR